MAGEIFICYRRADQVWARLLYNQIKAEGMEAWYDALVGPGQDWRIATAAALEASQVFVLLFSATAAQSTDIAKELAAATLEKKLIIPVRLENIAPKGAFLYELASRNWVNAYEDTEAKLAELAKGLVHLVRTGARDQSVLPFDRPLDRIKTRPRWRLPWLALAFAGIALLLAVCGLAAWLLWPAPHWTVESSRPFISTLALEDDPVFSPNGTMLAYTSGPEGGRRQIYVRNLAVGEGVRVVSDASDDISPTWSSDDARLAYVAVTPNEPCRIMVTTVPAGEAREAGRCKQAQSTPLSWQPGTSFVYAVENGGLKGDAIFRLNLDTGTRAVIVSKPAVRDIITSPRSSPDGKSLAYLLRGQQIVIQELTTGREKELGTVPEHGNTPAFLAWSEDSQTLLAGLAGDVGGSKIVAYPLDGTPSYSVYTTAMEIGNFATGGGLLALVTDISHGSLARATASPDAQPNVIDPANGVTWSPSFAPDGTLAFLSNRSSTNAIWLMKPGAAPSLLFDAGLSATQRVRFSPDGTKLAVAVETAQGVTIRIMTQTGANLSSLAMPSLGLGLPSWTPDSKAVLVFDRHSRRTVAVPIDNTARRSPFAPPHWVGIAVRKDGTFATRADRPGIWRIDGHVSQINDAYPAFYLSPLAFRGEDVLVPQYDPDHVPRIFAQPVSGGASHVVAYTPGAVGRSDFKSDLAVNPLNGEIVYTAVISRDTNIDLLKMTKR